MIRIQCTNPLKTGRTCIQFIHRRMCQIERIENTDILAQSLVIRHFSVYGIQKIPVEFPFLRKFSFLSKFLTHKNQLFARMCCHVTVRQTKCSKFIRNTSRHFRKHGAFHVNDFIVAQDKHKIFRILVNHAEGEHTMTPFTKQRVGADVLQIIIHPAHVPFQIKVKAALFDRTGHLRPRRRFLSNRKASIFSFMNFFVQIL